MRRDKAVQQFFLAGSVADAADLVAVHAHLHTAPPDGEAWTEQALKSFVELPAGRLRAALSLLRQHARVARPSDGGLRASGSALSARRAEALVTTERVRRDREQLAPERMDRYAASGVCRWSQLLDAFDRDEALPRCGVCDNCERIAKLEAAVPAQATSTRRTVGEEVPRMEPPVAFEPIAMRFQPDGPARVRKYGRGRVVREDAVGVTMTFADGSQCCFVREFVKPARAASKRGAMEVPAAPPAQPGRADHWVARAA